HRALSIAQRGTRRTVPVRVGASLDPIEILHLGYPNLNMSCLDCVNGREKAEAQGYVLHPRIVVLYAWESAPDESRGARLARLAVYVTDQGILVLNSPHTSGDLDFGAAFSDYLRDWSTRTGRPLLKPTGEGRWYHPDELPMPAGTTTELVSVTLEPAPDVPALWADIFDADPATPLPATFAGPMQRWVPPSKWSRRGAGEGTDGHGGEGGPDNLTGTPAQPRPDEPRALDAGEHHSGGQTGPTALRGARTTRAPTSARTTRASNPLRPLARVLARIAVVVGVAVVLLIGPLAGVAVAAPAAASAPTQPAVGAHTQLAGQDIRPTQGPQNPPGSHGTDRARLAQRVRAVIRGAQRFSTRLDGLGYGDLQVRAQDLSGRAREFSSDAESARISAEAERINDRAASPLPEGRYPGELTERAEYVLRDVTDPSRDPAEYALEVENLENDLHQLGRDMDRLSAGAADLRTQLAALEREQDDREHERLVIELVIGLGVAGVVGGIGATVWWRRHRDAVRRRATEHRDGVVSSVWGALADAERRLASSPDSPDTAHEPLRRAAESIEQWAALPEESSDRRTELARARRDLAELRRVQALLADAAGDAPLDAVFWRRAWDVLAGDLDGRLWRANARVSRERHTLLGKLAETLTEALGRSDLTEGDGGFLTPLGWVGELFTTDPAGTAPGWLREHWAAASPRQRLEFALELTAQLAELRAIRAEMDLAADGHLSGSRWSLDWVGKLLAEFAAALPTASAPVTLAVRPLLIRVGTRLAELREMLAIFEDKSVNTSPSVEFWQQAWNLLPALADKP
ncbi:MAG: hypothetical protein J2P32_10315, partial [Actinobacteria bacterium]|nr:hypothetical protein [Actinomycetota bacterium]